MTQQPEPTREIDMAPLLQDDPADLATAPDEDVPAAGDAQ
jgi:hypothetical protein